MSDPLERRCGSCARFVRVVETIGTTGEVRRAGECLLGVWPSPLYETSTCSQWVQRGLFKAAPEPRRRSPVATVRRAAIPSAPAPLTLPEDLLEMDAEDFKRVLSRVIREELGVSAVDMAGRWEGGEMILKPGREGLQEKRVSLDALFNKIIMIRDRLRLLEQKVNSNPKLSADEKIQLQQYVTGCYGSLTTFNVLFADREDQFVGQKGDEEPRPSRAVGLRALVAGRVVRRFQGGRAGRRSPRRVERSAPSAGRLFVRFSGRTTGERTSVAGQADRHRVRDDEQPIRSGPDRFPGRHGEARRTSRELLRRSPRGTRQPRDRRTLQEGALDPFPRRRRRSGDDRWGKRIW
jgi:hypothetical protein